jgi:hypothetical protein
MLNRAGVVVLRECLRRGRGVRSISVFWTLPWR